MNQPDDGTTTGEPQGEVATTVRLRRPWYKTLLTTALIGTVPLAVAGIASMQYLDAVEPQPTTAVSDNTSRYSGPIDDSIEHVASRRTVEIDPATGGVTVPAREDRVRELSGTGDLDMPAAALTAYRNAAATLATTDPSCNIDWALMAGIGRVESDHGRYGGATVSTNGKTYPHILGLPLDGSPGVAAIPDTDGGALDSDTTWDRAVGPMQFIPSTWGMVAADGDGDGERDPHDLDDAALAAGVYLCAGSADVSTRAGAEAAVFSYNHSDEYVALVLAIAEAYRSGEVYLPSVPFGSGGGSAPTLDRAPGNNGGDDASKPASAKSRTMVKGRPATNREGTSRSPEPSPAAVSSTKPSTEPAEEPNQSAPPSDAPAEDETDSAEQPPSSPPPPPPEDIVIENTLVRCGGVWCLTDLDGKTWTLNFLDPSMETQLDGLEGAPVRVWGVEGAHSVALISGLEVLGPVPEPEPTPSSAPDAASIGTDSSADTDVSSAPEASK
jgi:hypothetical protein